MSFPKCDHPPSAVFVYRYKGQVVKYCLACMFEKSGITPYHNSADPFILRGEKSPYVADEEEIVTRKVKSKKNKRD